MRDIVLQLLAEKLIDEFYARDRPPSVGADSNYADIEQMKASVPKDKWDQLFLVESRAAELGAEELKRFAEFVAQIMIGTAKGTAEY